MDIIIPTIGDTLIQKNTKEEHILKGFSDCKWKTEMIDDFCRKCPGHLVFTDNTITCGYGSGKLLYDIKKQPAKNNKFCLRDRL